LSAMVWPGAVKWAALASLALFGLSFLWALIDREKRCWHDVIANTWMISLGDATD